VYFKISCAAFLPHLDLSHFFHYAIFAHQKTAKIPSTYSSKPSKPHVLLFETSAADISPVEDASRAAWVDRNLVERAMVLVARK